MVFIKLNEEMMNMSGINIKRDEKEFFAVMDEVPFAVVLINMDHTIYFANKAATKLFKGQKGTGSLINKTERHQEAHTNSFVDNPVPGTTRRYLYREDGSFIPVLNNTQTITLNNTQYYLELMVDITNEESRQEELRRKTNELREIIDKKAIAEEKARRESEKFEMLFEELSDALILHDLNGNILKVNQKTCDRLGYTREQMLSMNIADIDNKAHRIRIRDRIAFLREEKHMKFESIHLTKNGEEIPVEIVSKVVEFDEQEAILSSVRNITVRKKYEYQLIKAKEKAEESDRLKTEFLNNISHQIRTPLNGIMGFSELVGDEDLTSEQRSKYIQKIHERGERLLNTVNDIVEIATLGSGSTELIKEEFHLKEALNDLVGKLKEKADNNGVDFIFNYDDAIMDEKIETDKPKLLKALEHLTENAFKYTYKGKVQLSVKSYNGEHIAFSVEDTGVGISPQDLKAIFKPFHQTEYTIKQAINGNGLGLTIAEKLVNCLGSNIEAESRLGEGSKFSFTLKCLKNSKDN
ncbi:MAG: PAS domain S-box protein [Bacteroidales bacterium]|nr:PAS domain S-box protein [Bacteroidales bacterium]